MRNNCEVQQQYSNLLETDARSVSSPAVVLLSCFLCTFFRCSTPQKPLASFLLPTRLPLPSSSLIYLLLPCDSTSQHSFINDLDDEAECTLSKWEDYTELEGRADVPECYAAMQRDLNKLEKWGSWWTHKLSMNQQYSLAAKKAHGILGYLSIVLAPGPNVSFSADPLFS